MSNLSRASLEARKALQAQIIQAVAAQPGITVRALADRLGRTALSTGAIIGWMGRSGQITIIRPPHPRQCATLYPTDGSAGPRHVRRPKSFSRRSDRSLDNAITDEDRQWMAYWKARREARIAQARAAQENHP